METLKIENFFCHIKIGGVSQSALYCSRSSRNYRRSERTCAPTSVVSARKSRASVERFTVVES